MTDTTQEIIIRKSIFDRLIGYICIFIAFIWGSYVLAFRSDWKGFIGISLSLIVLVVHNKEFKGLPILLKIASDGLWTPKHGYKPWRSILKVRFTRIYRGNTYRRYVEIYKSDSPNPDEVIDITSMNAFKSKLKRELQKYVQVE